MHAVARQVKHRFAQRFAAMWDASQAASGSGSTANSAALILIGQSTPTGMDSEMLTKLQTLRLGR